MLNIGPQELILVLIIALVVVGPKRLPELGRTIGRGMREFRKMQSDVRDTLKLDLDPDLEPPTKAVARPQVVHGTEPDDADGVVEEPPAADVEPGTAE
jgi:sec-independent protein translocase protein TatA